MRGTVLALLVMAMPTQAAAPVVYRGSTATAASAVPAPAAPTAVAGSRLWLVDPDRRGVTGCALERTTRVGQRRIRCTGGTLP